MKNEFAAEAQVTVNAPAEKVWEALTNPELIKKYFFGTLAVSDWKVGSSLIFKGEWEGKEYIDKGIILESKKPNLFRYTYLSSMSALEDKPENYAEITYQLVEHNGKTELKVTQNNVATLESKQHSEQNWLGVLNGLKELVEKETVGK